MSHRPISRSPDLQKLRNEGYDIAIQSGFLLVRQVPYARTDRTVDRGILVSPLELANDVAQRPRDHVVFWTGDMPCDANGSPLSRLVNQSSDRTIIEDLVAHHSFSQKPAEGYVDYHHKMTNYVRMLEGPAQALVPGVTARVFPVVRTDEAESVFTYEDTASSRAGIVPITQKLEKGRIAIVGVGGTGSYVLDHIAKTPVAEIHLYDGDRFLQHNAFRSPGAPSAEELERGLRKVEWFAELYSHMHRRIIPHPYDLDETNVSELLGMEFVFLCIDRGSPKRSVVEFLIGNNIPFIDVGMGLHIEGESLAGLARVTTAVPGKTESVVSRIPFTDGENEEYAQNIQVSDLNALNAALAVIRWKKLWGFYSDLQGERSTTYMVSMNKLLNEVTNGEAQEPST